MVNPIPDTAQEVIHETWETGAKKSAFCYQDAQRIGYRSWSASGCLDMEYGINDGKMHGAFRTWHENGQLCEHAFYEHGKEHGITKQYDETGRLLGSYAMEHGTGIDLWFVEPGIVTVERHYQYGVRHGYERWWTGDNQTISQESHFWQGCEHGIFRHWNAAGRLRRGYPSYFVGGQRVTTRQYERACRTDPTPPVFVASENTPLRQLPQALRKQSEASSVSIS
jgi:antitoxin component YwqK of YwqJK toxin-antitoxin module